MLISMLSEFMSRGSLYDFLHKQKGVFKLPFLLKVAIDVSKGMNYLHQNNIIHRDLKTANLLMDENEVSIPRLLTWKIVRQTVAFPPSWIVVVMNSRQKWSVFLVRYFSCLFLYQGYFIGCSLCICIMKFYHYHILYLHISYFISWIYFIFS